MPGLWASPTSEPRFPEVGCLGPRQQVAGALGQQGSCVPSAPLASRLRSKAEVSALSADGPRSLETAATGHIREASGSACPSFHQASQTYYVLGTVPGSEPGQGHEPSSHLWDLEASSYHQNTPRSFCESKWRIKINRRLSDPVIGSGNRTDRNLRCRQYLDHSHVVTAIL